MSDFQIKVGVPQRLDPFNSPDSYKDINNKEYSKDEVFSFVRYLMEKGYIQPTSRWEYIKTLQQDWERDYKERKIWY